ncbi:MAG: hypothetical protein WHS46_12495 [Desulfosoma sp.]
MNLHECEREQAQALLPFIPSSCVPLFERGYPSFNFISYLRDIDRGYFLFRCPAERTFSAVEAFVRSGR